MLVSSALTVVDGSRPRVGDLALQVPADLASQACYQAVVGRVAGRRGKVQAERCSRSARGADRETERGIRGETRECAGGRRTVAEPPNIALSVHADGYDL